MATTVHGKGNISATVRANSINHVGVQMISLEIDYMRFFHSEFMTHRMLSKCSASSRAIPVVDMHRNIQSNTARPIEYGKNRRGMQATEMLDDQTSGVIAKLWDGARDTACAYSATMSALGAHKQIANRITEPFQMMKVIVSGTEWANLKHLRHHPMALPEFYELLDVMISVVNQSTPVLLHPGEWHLPYVNSVRDSSGVLKYYDSDGQEMSLDIAKKVSTSCCAQTSYRKSNDAVGKAEELFQTLIESQPVHASPVEHQATPMAISELPVYSPFDPSRWEPGVTHVDSNRYLWSGNLKGWIQHRKLIPGEAVW